MHVCIVLSSKCIIPQNGSFLLSYKLSYFSLFFMAIWIDSFHSLKIMWRCYSIVCVVLTNRVKPNPSVCGGCPQPCLEISCTPAKKRIPLYFFTFNLNSSFHWNLQISLRVVDIFFSPSLSLSFTSLPSSSEFPWPVLVFLLMGPK